MESEERMEVNNIQNMAGGEKAAPLTSEEMLESVNSAIVAIASGGQSYRIGSREFTRADIKALYSIKNDLTTKINDSGDSHLLDNCYVGVFSGR